MPRVSRDLIVMSSPQNPVASFLGDWIDSDFMKDLFLTCPKAAIQMRVGVPEEVQLEIVDVVENLVFFKASLQVGSSVRQIVFSQSVNLCQLFQSVSLCLQ